jgi:hypothetical protein
MIKMTIMVDRWHFLLMATPLRTLQVNLDGPVTFEGLAQIDTLFEVPLEPCSTAAIDTVLACSR